MQLGHVVFIHAGIESMGPSRTGWTDRTRPTPQAANSEPKIHAKAMAAWALPHTLRHRPRYGAYSAAQPPIWICSKG